MSCSRSLSVSTTVQDGGTHGAVANCPDCPPLPTQGIWEEVSHGVIQSADTELTMAISNPIWSKVNNTHCWFHVDLLQNAAAAMFGESLSSVPGNLVSVSRLLTLVFSNIAIYTIYSKIQIQRLSKEKAPPICQNWDHCWWRVGRGVGIKAVGESHCSVSAGSQLAAMAGSMSGGAAFLFSEYCDPVKL